MVYSIFSKHLPPDTSKDTTENLFQIHKVHVDWFTNSHAQSWPSVPGKKPTLFLWNPRFYQQMDSSPAPWQIELSKGMEKCDTPILGTYPLFPFLEKRTTTSICHSGCIDPDVDVSARTALKHLEPRGTCGKSHPALRHCCCKYVLIHPLPSYILSGGQQLPAPTLYSIGQSAVFPS